MRRLNDWRIPSDIGARSWPSNMLWPQKPPLNCQSREIQQNGYTVAAIAFSESGCLDRLDGRRDSDAAPMMAFLTIETS